MTSQLPSAAAPAPKAERPGLAHCLGRGEDLLMALVLAGVLLLPVAEIALRPLPYGISGGASPIVQHLVLIVGLLGGALAARQGRLLSISTLTTLFSARWQARAGIFTGAVAVLISGLLGLAGWRFAWRMREAGQTLAYGVPVWVLQLVLPAGFALIAWRLLWRSGPTSVGRMTTLLLAATGLWSAVRSIGSGMMSDQIELTETVVIVAVTAVFWTCALVASWLLWRGSSTWPGRLLSVLPATFVVAVTILVALRPVGPAGLLLPAMGLLAIATLLGAPIFTALGGAAVVLFWWQDQSIDSVAVDHYEMVINPSLPAVCLFTLAGFFLAEGGASQRLVRLFGAVVGQFRGGPAIVTALACAFFTSFTGASGVTILALGALLMPVLLEAGYSKRNATGLLTGAGSLGLLFPPCLPLILYAIVATTAGTSHGIGDLSVERMFLGGIVPGMLLLVLTALWGVIQSPRLGGPKQRFKPVEAGRALWVAKWELLLPVVALVALFGGWATMVEAAAVTALYAFIAEAVFYRDLKLRRVPGVMAECGLMVGGVLLILGVAMGLTNFLIFEQIPDRLVDLVKEHIESPYLFLLALNGLLLVVGCLMDIYSAIVVIVPLLVPIAAHFQIDPVHLGIIFLANMELGYVTPPVGMNLFLASLRFGQPMPQIIRAVIPMFFVLLVGVLLITYIPILTTALPHWLQ